MWELIFLIWLCVTRLILLIILIVLCACVACKKDRKKELKYLEEERRYGNHGNGRPPGYDNSSFDPVPEHKAGMFAGTTPTLSNDGTNPKAVNANGKAGMAAKSPTARAYSQGTIPRNESDSSAGPGLGSGDDDWLGSMREEVFAEYAMSTTEKPARPPKPSRSGSNGAYPTLPR